MYKTKTRAAVFGILFGILLAAVFFAADYISLRSCNAGTQGDGRISGTRLLMGTSCTIIISSEDVSRTGADAAAALIDAAFGLCAESEALFSMNIEGSDVRRINTAGGQPAEVNPQTINVISEGLRFCELSDGMFDITIGRLSELWGISSNPDSKLTVPADYEIDICRQTVDYRQVIISDYTVQLNNPDARIDLGGIAKGYIADKVAAFFAEHGVKNALIDLGGDIVVLGNRQEGGAWRLGVQEPFGSGADLIGVLEVSDAAVVSSGIYERQFVSDGRAYHHIIDPRTGMPSQSDVTGATIIADNAVTGEGLSTIAVLAGSAKAREICGQTPGFIGAVLVLDSGEVLTFGEAELRDK